MMRTLNGHIVIVYQWDLKGNRTVYRVTKFNFPYSVSCVAEHYLHGARCQE